ncbi:hypothetical protein B7463_g10831, partial [Scytalidium lignicola]
MSVDHEGQDEDEMRSSLHEINSQHSKPIPRLVNIQSSQMAQKKSLKFIRNLECLYFPKSHKRPYDGSRTEQPVLLRQQINAFEDGNYVALSYTWSPSPYEVDVDLRSGSFKVQRRNSAGPKQSPVRNTVLERAKRYMDYVGVKYLWIDQHCIEQKEGKAKERGMQAMDLVYSLSEHPVALLARRIESSEELQLLVQILRGELVQERHGRFYLAPSTSKKNVLKAVQLLKDITSDLWWTRGWTFQENYRAGTKMALLVPHLESLENMKPYIVKPSRRRNVLLGRLRGELCLNSVTFHTAATKLCLAYQGQQPPGDTLCDSILERAGKYTILLQAPNKYGNMSAPKSMTPTIIADIADRQLEQIWDRLSIVANCCQYSVRLNSLDLRTQGHSLSLSMLALYLLNGEILSNHPDDEVDDPRTTKSLNIVEFLKMQSFKGLYPPFSKRGLTFNKSCRFVDVKLTEEGIQTTGHLWKLDTLIPTKSFSCDLPFEPISEHGLNPKNRRRLRQLVGELSDRRCEFLCERLDQFLDDDFNVDETKTFAKQWKDLMAVNLIEAINDGKMLCTASLVSDYKQAQHSGGIFIIEDLEDSDSDVSDSSRDETEGSGGEERVLEEPVHIFTSSQPREEGSETLYPNDIDRHVSMEVDSPDLGEKYCSSTMPHLYTKRWIHGLCFFDGCPRQKVIFPWPASLQSL